MAGGNLGDLQFSLSIKSDIEKKLDQYGKKIDSLNNFINVLQGRINHAAERLSKLAEGSDAWKQQKQYVASLYHEIDGLVSQTRIYEQALGRVQAIQERVAKGGLIGPGKTITSLLDTKPIESQIEKYESLVNTIQSLQAKINERKGYKDSIVLDAEQGTKGTATWEEYQRRITAVDSEIEKLSSDLKALGGEAALTNAKAQLESLYNVLSSFDSANRKAAESTSSHVSEEQRRAKAIKDARIAFEPLVAAQAREAQQESANKANIEANNQARQKQVQTIREQARAMMEARESALQEQKVSLGKLYTQGKSIGLDPSELETILSRYREISAELLNLRTMMQNTKGLSASDMFSAGRVIGPGSGYVKEATEQVSMLRTRTQEAVSSARELASAFDRVHGAAARSSSVLSDIKSMFLSGGIVFGAQQFANSVIQTGGDIVQQHIALRSILGDVQKADELFAQTQQLALQSPFTFQELNRDVKQLSAFGVDTDKLYDTTRRLADVASGLGVSFERLGLAYGQVKARSWLDGKELRQFAYAGLPMLQKIADLYNEQGKNGRNNYTTSEVKNMVTKRQVSFEDVDEVFKRLTDKGGQFYNMQFVLSDTLLGRWNKLQDAWSIMLGKFADGENVFGKVFSTAINGVTNLILQLDRLSPILLSFGTMFAGKKILGAASALMGVGVNNIVKQMSLVQAQQLKTYAATQMQKVAEGEISAEIAQQNVLKQRQLLASTGVKDLTYAQVFAEGKISAMQLAQLARRGEVTAALITQLRTMGLISAKQEQLILQAKEEGFVRSRTAMARLGAGSAASKIGGLLSGGNLAMIGASVGMALWMGYEQWSSRIEQSTKAAADHAKQLAKQMQSEITSARTSGVSEQTVKQMQEVVEQSGLYTQSMQEQVEQASTLQEKYDALLKVMQQMSSEATNMQNYSANAESAIKATSVMSYKGYLRRAWSEANNWQPLEALSDVLGFGALGDLAFNDDIDKNLEQYTTSRTQYDNSVSQMQDYASKIHSVLEGIKGDYSDTYAAIQGKPFEEQLRILSDSDAWDKIVDQISKNDRSFKGLADTYIDKTSDVDNKWGEIVNDDVPRLAADLADQYHMNLNEFEEYCKKHPQFASAMIREVVASLQQGNQATKNQLLKVLLEFFGLADQYAANIKAQKPKSKYEQETTVGKQLLKSVVDKYGNGVVSVEDINKIAGANDDYAKAKKNIQQQYNDANENYVAAKNAGVSGSSLSALKNERDKWQKLATANGITVQSKSDREAASRQRAADKAQRDEERQREREEREFMRSRQKEASSIQSYYDTWDKWRKVEGDAAARNRVANDPRFSASFRATYSDPEKLADNYMKLANSIAQTSDERTQFVQELKSKAAEKEAQQEYEDAQRLNNVFKEQLDNLSKRYDLYQRLAKVAGKGVAGGVAFGSMSHSESYYSYLMNRLQSMQSGNVKDFVENGGVAGNVQGITITANAPKIDFSNHGGLEGVLGMADEDVLSEYGTNVSNLIKSLKAERDKLDASIVDSLEQGYSYFQEYGNEIDSINQKYDEQIERLQQRNKLDKDDKDYLSDKDLKQQTTILQQQRQREVVGAGWKNFQNTDTYRQFFGATYLLGSKEAEKYGQTIKEKVTDVFMSGGMTAEEYANKIEDINKAMDDVRNNRSNMFTYLFGGGIDGLTQKKYNQGKQQVDYYSGQYSEYLRQYQEAQAKGDEEGMSKAKNAMSESQSMIDAGNNMMKGASKAASTVAIIDKIVNGINDNVQKLKALMDDIADTIETFSGKEHADNFRNSAGYTFVSGFSNASQGATDAWNSLKSGNVMGVVEGGFRSIIGWATPWAQRHDAKLQKQIETAERTNKLIDSMRNSIERRLSNSLGGVYGYTSNKRDTQKIKDGLDNYSLAKTGARYGRNTVAQSSGAGVLGGAALGLGTAVGMGAIGGAMSGLGAGVGAGAALGGVAGPIGAAVGAVIGGIFGGLFGHRRKRYKTNYTEDTYESMVRANQTQAYYDQMLASYKMQRDNLNAQMKAEDKKKNSDKDKISDYKSQLEELDDKIKTFAKDIAKSLYDIDVKSWAKELTDSVVSTWAAGEDAVEAYKDKVKDMMKTLATNIISQKIMEIALQPVEDYIEKVMASQSGILNEDNIVAIADMLAKIGDTTVPSIVDVLEKLKARGWDLSDTNSASMSSSIKGISEATADLLASYANASRADISIIRQQLGLALPEFNMTARAQLQQLNAIAQNTLRNADAAERIETSVIEVVSILNAVVHDSKQMSVRVK